MLEVTEPDRVGNVRDVDAGIRFARHEELVRRELREALLAGRREEEVAQEVVHVARVGLVVELHIAAVAVGEAHADAVLQVEHVGVQVPGVRVARQLLAVRVVRVGAQRAHLVHVALERGASRPAVGPQHDGRVGRAVLREHEDVVEAALVAGSRRAGLRANEAGVLARGQRVVPAGQRVDLVGGDGGVGAAGEQRRAERRRQKEAG